MTTQQTIYQSSPELYDAIYSNKPYAQESEEIHKLLRKLGIDNGAVLLEAACGSGNYLNCLRSWYDVAGFDIHQKMLELAQQKLPNVELFQADMTNFVSPRSYDVIVCLFSSIGYVFPLHDLEKTAQCFADAIRPGGILLVEPWFTEEQFVSGRMILQSHEDDSLKCSRACIANRQGDFAILNFSWLVMRSGDTEPQHFTEQHKLWLCPRELQAGVLRNAGFSVSIDSKYSNRGLLICRRQSTSHSKQV